MKRIVGSIIGLGLLAACGGVETSFDGADGEPAETAVVNASEAQIVGIAKALAEFESLQETCEYGSAKGLTMTFINELIPTPSGLEHSDKAIVTVGEVSGLFVGAELENICTPEMYEQFEGRADDALAAWNKIKSGD